MTGCVLCESVILLWLFQNLDLTQDARATRALRDELDIIKEKVSVKLMDMFKFQIILSHMSIS